MAKEQELNDMIDPGNPYPTGDLPDEPPKEEPKQEEPGQEPVVESQEPTGDEPAPDTSEETPNPYDQKFQDKGLNQQFQNVGDMLDRVPYLNQYTTRVSQENADLKRQIEEFQKTPPVDRSITADDAFFADPTKQLDNRYLTTDAAQKIVQQMQTQEAKMMQMQVDAFKAQHDDFEQLRPLMLEIGQADPGYYQLNNPIGVLYEEAKRVSVARSAPIQAVAQGQANQSISQERLRATTTGTGNKPKSRNLTPQDMYDMPMDELEKHLGYSDGQ